MALLNKITEVLKTDLSKDISFRKKTEEVVLESTFVEKLKQRRSIHVLGKKVHLSQTYLAQLILESVRSCPSALNSQSTRIVVLFNDSHHAFWDIVQDVQRRHMPAAIFEAEKLKIQQCQNAFGSILFFEDQTVIRELQKQKPLSAADFPIWSEQTLGMAQFAAWTALSETGLGACLQHYNPTIDHAVADYFSIDCNWKMRAQLVFGSIEKAADEKAEALLDDAHFKICI